MRDEERSRHDGKRRGCLPFLGWVAAVVCVVLALGLFFNAAGITPGRIFSVLDSSDASSETAADSAGSVSGDTIQALEAMARQYPKMEPILKHSDRYPAQLLESLSRNSELLTFALDYPEKKGTWSDDIDLSDRYQLGEMPLLLQWDEEWGYAPYGNGMIALDGCGPTCLSMVAVGLTGDTSLNPKAVADFSAENGYLDDQSNSTLWALMTEGAEKLGLRSKEVPLSESRMSEELSEGHPLICSMRAGDFTVAGHFIVLCGYQNGEFSVNDPNSTVRSGEKWSYEKLKPQIRNIWAFSA